MRHRQRHVHATIVQHVREILDAAGWISDPVNFGTTPVTLIDYEPQQAGVTPAFNTVAVSIGDQSQDNVMELGGGLHECRYALFIDIYPIQESIGIAIADDLKAELTDQLIPLKDFTLDPLGVEVESQIEFDAVIVEVVPSAATTLDKRSWRVVKATAACFF